MLGPSRDVSPGSGNLLALATCAGKAVWNVVKRCKLSRLLHSTVSSNHSKEKSAQLCFETFVAMCHIDRPSE